ncbi:MAG TPA: SurA N-terminal domain-containing protein [Rhizobacter sp.]|nr:SurA N-terminal domain-containing protein [Rhizobacter sp.]
MFDFFRKHTWVLRVILGFVVVAFVGGGVYQGYGSFMNNSEATVAKVDGRKITRTEWEAAQREQVERVRRQMPNVDPKLFDTPQLKRQVLDGLVRERVMLAAAEKAGFSTTEERLLRTYLTDPQFAPFRNPDGSVNKEALQAAVSAQGMTIDGFEQRMRQELALRQVLFGINGTVIAPATSTASALDAMFQQREVQLQRFNPQDYAGKVNVTAAEVETYYKNPAHAAEFQSPEQASIEYVVLDLDAIKKGVSVSEDELRKYYAENENRYTTPEERRASHILIKADKSAAPQERSQAKAKAESLLAELRKKPSAFAELARKNSQDPGSAGRGGDLDFFDRGAMVKPFEDAAYALKPGEISNVVESDFGYHIIQLTQVRGGEKRSFESVRAEIEDEVKKQLAQKRFADAAVEFTNSVYEQADSLKPAADKLKLEVHTAKGVQRTPVANAEGPLAAPKFLEALFGSDTLRNKRNTEAIETGPNQLVSGRVVQYVPAALLPLSEVTPRIKEKLAAVQAAALARKDGEARLSSLRQAPQTDLGSPAQTVSRIQARTLARPLIDAVLKAPTDTLPTFVGVDLGDQGYALLKVTKILGRDPAAADVTQAAAQYAQAWGTAEGQAYFAALKTRFKAAVTAPQAPPDAPAAASGASR